MTNRRHLLVGLVSVAAAVAFLLYIGVKLAGTSGNTYPVTVTFSRAGQLLKVRSDVKLRGVLVGKVSKIELTEDGKARITLAMDPGQQVPVDVTASIRGKTLFGEKFVQLIDTSTPSNRTLEPGDNIPESSTVDPFELEQVLVTGLPVLEAADPGDLGGALHALAEGFAGQEEEARRAIDNGLSALRALNAESASLDRVLSGLDEGAEAFARASPDLVAALRDLDRLNQTIIANREDVAGALRDVPKWLDSLGQLIEARYVDLVDLSVKGSDILQLVARKRDGLPFTINALKNFTQSWVTNMSLGCTRGGSPANQDEIGEIYPQLNSSTCWQIWNLSAEGGKNPGGYSAANQPTPNSRAASRAYLAQLRHLLSLPFGDDLGDVAALLYGPLRNRDGLLPEEIL